MMGGNVRWKQSGMAMTDKAGDIQTLPPKYIDDVGHRVWIPESSFVYNPSAAAQEKEICHDVLFREGRNLMREVTYTPRLIAVDLKGSLNTLRQEGTLYDVKNEEDVHWENDVTLHTSIKPEKNEFLQDLEREEEDETNSIIVQDKFIEAEDDGTAGASNFTDTQSTGHIFGPKHYDLDGDVNVWSDFLRIHLHPRSLNIIQEYSNLNETEPFDIFGCGEAIYSNYDRRVEMEDQIHYFTEECDNLQGFHIMTDTNDGFGGITSWISQYLHEEFPTKGTLALALTPATFPNYHPKQKIHRLITTLLSYDNIVSNSSLFVPVSMATSVWKSSEPSVNLPYLKYQSDLSYHTSAILAAALDTATLPYRLETAPSRLTDITHSFHHLGRKVAGLSIALPFPMLQSHTLVDRLMSYQGRQPWTSITPGVPGLDAPFMQSVVLRGIPDNLVKNTGPNFSGNGLLSQCDSGNDVMKLYLTEMFPTTLNGGCVLRQPCKVTTPYPHIFSPMINQGGWLSDTERSTQQGVDSVPAMTSLQSSSEIGHFLRELHTEASKVNIKKYHQFLENGLEEDNFRESLECLSNLCQCYES